MLLGIHINCRAKHHLCYPPVHTLLESCTGEVSDEMLSTTLDPRLRYSKFPGDPNNCPARHYRCFSTVPREKGFTREKYVVLSMRHTASQEYHVTSSWTQSGCNS